MDIDQTIGKALEAPNQIIIKTTEKKEIITISSHQLIEEVIKNHKEKKKLSKEYDKIYHRITDKDKFETDKEKKDKIQQLRISTFAKFNFEATKNLEFNITPIFLYTYNSIVRPSKKFKNLSLFHNIYLSSDFKIQYNKISYKNITPNGFLFNFAITPIQELTKVRSTNLKLHAQSICKFHISESMYISNTTQFGHIFNLNKNHIPDDLLFSLNVITGFVNGGGFDIISRTAVKGQTIISNVLAIHKRIHIPEFAPIINHLETSFFVAIGTLYNNKYNTKYYKKNQIVIGNGKFHASIGAQLTIQSLFLPPIYLIFAFDVINPVKQNNKAFDKFLYSVGESLLQ